MTSIAEASDECAIPLSKEVHTLELPDCSHDEFATVIQDYKDLFRFAPGTTISALQYSNYWLLCACTAMMNPSTYRVEEQIQEMLK